MRYRYIGIQHLLVETLIINIAELLGRHKLLGLFLESIVLGKVEVSSACRASWATFRAVDQGKRLDAVTCFLSCLGLIFIVLVQYDLF